VTGPLLKETTMNVPFQVMAPAATRKELASAR
jgi:hypothetical protein